jgi:general secretion pathway protein B
LSSILRALKKLESEPGRQAGNEPLATRLVPLADTGAAGSPAKAVMMVAGTGIVCGVVVLAGWFLFSEKARAPSPAGQETSRQEPLQAETPQGAFEETKTAATPRRPGEPDPAAVAVLEPPEALRQEVAVPQPAPVKIVQKTILPAARPLPAPEPAAPAVAREKPSPQHPAATAADRQAAPAAVPEPDIPPLNDPGIRLQAITWSKAPGKRLVVINNRILRQGDTVSGYRIDTVNQDDVVLSSGGEKWKVLFRIK